jgi:hypothetical protein
LPSVIKLVTPTVIKGVIFLVVVVVVANACRFKSVVVVKVVEEVEEEVDVMRFIKREEKEEENRQVRIVFFFLVVGFTKSAPLRDEAVYLSKEKIRSGREREEGQRRRGEIFCGVTTCEIKWTSHKSLTSPLTIVQYASTHEELVFGILRALSVGAKKS